MSAYIPQTFVPLYYRKMLRKDAKMKGKKVEMQFGRPNFPNEWSEISDAKIGDDTVLDLFKHLGKSKWMTLAKKGKIVRYTFAQARKIENTLAPSEPFKNLLPSKKANVLKQINKGKIELSIVANFGGSDRFRQLIAGNTRLTAQMEVFGEGYVWQFDVKE